MVPYNTVATVSDGGPAYREMFEYGCASKTIQERGSRVKLLSQHNSRNNPLGRATLLREDARGLYGEFSVSRTQAGDEVLELVRDGALDSFSIGFTPVKHERRDGVTVRKEIAIREASIVTMPAYEGAVIEAVRASALIQAGYTPDSVMEALADPIDLSLLRRAGETEVEYMDRMVANFRGVTLTPEQAAVIIPALPRTQTPATTDDGQSERTHDNDGEPAGATPDALTRFRHLRHMARERGII